MRQRSRSVAMRQRGFGGAPAWTPAALPSLAAWYTADPAYLFQERTGASATTPAAADGDPVGTWLDRSGNARHLTAATDAKRPTLKLVSGRWYVRIDAVDDDMDFPAGFAQSLPFYGYFTMSNTGGTVGYRQLLSRNPTTGPSLYAGNGMTGALRPAVWWASLGATYGSDVSGLHAVRYRIASAAVTGVAVDGGAEATGATTGTVLGDWTKLGGGAPVSQHLGADVGEIVLAQGTTLSAGEDASLLTYIRAAWGTP